MMSKKAEYRKWRSMEDGKIGTQSSILYLLSSIVILAAAAAANAQAENPFCVQEGFNLRPGSPAIDAGAWISGFHCPESGQDPGTGCVPWCGQAPDIGACEYCDDDSPPPPPPPPTNTPPMVNAGPDQTILLSQSANLTGSVSDDGLPNGQVVSNWRKASGPRNGVVSFIDANQITTSARFSRQGLYVLRLWASDGALESSDDMIVTVKRK